MTGRRGVSAIAGAGALACLMAGCSTDVTGPSRADAEPTAGLTARVVKVIDGDTVDVRVEDGSRLRVRLLGIDAPEVAHGADAGTCGGDQSLGRARELLRDKQVVLLADPTQVTTDRFGRRLAYVEIDGEDVGRRLIFEGWATAWYPAQARRPVRHDRYRSVQAEAEAARRGIWAFCPPGRNGRRNPVNHVAPQVVRGRGVLFARTTAAGLHGYVRDAAGAGGASGAGPTVATMGEDP